MVCIFSAARMLAIEAEINLMFVFRLALRETRSSAQSCMPRVLGSFLERRKLIRHLSFARVSIAIAAWIASRTLLLALIWRLRFAECTLLLSLLLLFPVNRTLVRRKHEHLLLEPSLRKDRKLLQLS
jgi:hypothetical protein